MNLAWTNVGARALLPALVAAAALMSAPAASAATPPSDFEEEMLGYGLSSPVAAAPAPDGRTFVAEKPGRVRVVDSGGELRAQPVLDISDKVNAYHDRGLLGIAVDRDFASNGYLYLLYTVDVDQLVRDSAKPMTARLSRVTVSPDSTASAETTILGSYDQGPCPPAADDLDCIPSDGLSHSIGTVRVDPADGSLFVGVGDSASFTSKDDLAFRTYDERSMAGKIIHVDRDGRGLPGHAFCPTEADLSKVCAKLHAKGFRNPFRFSLRSGKPLVAGDVGWDAREELDIVRAGGNYGWPCWEGGEKTPGYRDDPRCWDLYAAEGDSKPLKPLYSYHHVDSSGPTAAIVGGPQMNGASWPDDQRGSIYFGDYAKGFLKRIRVDDSDVCLDNDSEGACQAQPFADDWYGSVDLQEDPGGALLYVDFGDGGPTGSLRRTVYTAGNKRPIARASADPRYGAAPLDVQLSSEGSSDPEGTPLTYLWDFGDGSPSSTDPNPRHAYASDGTYAARLTVSDGERSATSQVTITPGNSPPTATIDSPADGSRYRAGQTIDLSATAQDPDDGPLAPPSLEWRVTLVHNSHDHPLTTLTGERASFTAGDDHDADSFYRITLHAVDRDGLDVQHTVSIRPETVSFQINSEPESGAPVSYGGTDAVTPHSRTSAIGYKTSVTAGETFSKLGRRWVFDRWSDGGSRSHVVTIPITDNNVTAYYREDKAAARPAAASSTERAGLEPEKANDADSSTRWSSSYADDQWWQVDLGTVRRVDTVELDWEPAYASQYKVLTSTDGIKFTERALDGAAGQGLERTAFAAADARYVRILGVTRATVYGFSFWDARVTGPPDPPPPDPPPPDPLPPPAAKPIPVVPKPPSIVPDRSGPSIAFNARRGLRRRMVLMGRASDSSGVKRMQVAVTSVRDPRCRRWSPRRRRFGRASRRGCARPAFFAARLRRSAGGYAWAARLGARLPRGRYVVTLRAEDGRGNVTRRAGRRAARVTVR